MIDVDITGQLIPNLLTVLVQLCSTLVLFLLAKKFLWKSVKNWLDARTSSEKLNNRIQKISDGYVEEDNKEKYN